MYEVMGQSDYPRNVVNLELVVDAPSDEDVRTLVESARDEALMERRRHSLVVNRELVNNWTCTPPSACVFKADGFSWVIDEPVGDILGRAILVTEDTWCPSTFVAMAHEFAFRMLQTMKLFPGVSDGFARTSCLVAPNVVLRLEVTGQVLLQKTCYTPVLEIPISLRSTVIRTVKRVSLTLEYSHFCTPALIVVSVSGRGTGHFRVRL